MLQREERRKNAKQIASSVSCASSFSASAFSSSSSPHLLFQLHTSDPEIPTASKSKKKRGTQKRSANEAQRDAV